MHIIYPHTNHPSWKTSQYLRTVNGCPLNNLYEKCHILVHYISDQNPRRHAFKVSTGENGLLLGSMMSSTADDFYKYTC